tara:strand:+ start:1331 stop:1441 length:111 start_codon:yes stop_codon:yes gene_type:complete
MRKPQTELGLLVTLVIGTAGAVCCFVGLTYLLAGLL